MRWDSGEPDVPDVYSERLIDLLGPARRADESVTSAHENLAASVQRVFEEAAFHVLRGAHARIPSDALCLAGGCAMNSVANGKIRSTRRSGTCSSSPPPATTAPRSARRSTRGMRAASRSIGPRDGAFILGHRVRRGRRSRR